MPRSPSLDRLPEYPLGDLPARRAAVEARGIRVLNLGPGDADLLPPPRVVERLREVVLESRYSRYGFQRGLPEFREEAAGWMERRFGVVADPYEELHPLIGSKEGLAHLLLGCLGPGDVAILPDPGFHSYEGAVIMAGAEPHLVRLSPENGYRLDPEALPGGVVDRARILLLNYPNNPTAASVELDYFQRIVEFCREKGIGLIHDHAYSEIAFDGYRPPSVLQVPGAEEVAVELHSLSKTYNMTGWRLGWAVGNRRFIRNLVEVKSLVDTGPPLAIQAAGLEALRSPEAWMRENVELFRRRRDVGVQAFRDAGFRLQVPRATIYLWVAVPGGWSSAEFCRRALNEVGVVLLPGSSFGAGGEGYFRAALTVDEPELQEAAERLAGLEPAS